MRAGIPTAGIPLDFLPEKKSIVCVPVVGGVILLHKAQVLLAGHAVLLKCATA